MTGRPKDDLSAALIERARAPDFGAFGNNVTMSSTVAANYMNASDIGS